MAFNEYHVRNTHGADVAGQGTTHATAYKTIQFAIDDVVATHGRNVGSRQDRYNLCDESPFVLSESLTIASHPMHAWAVLQGYTASPGDGGRFDVDLDGGAYPMVFSTHDYTVFADGAVHNNSGSNALLDLSGVGQKVLRMELYDCEHRAVDGAGTNGASVEQCYVHDCAGTGVHRVGRVFGCFLRNGATRKFTVAIETYRGMCDFNILLLDGASDGIYADAYQHTRNNSILCDGGTGVGITRTLYLSDFMNNVVEGFSGAGGVGIQGFNENNEDWPRNNACFNNATNYGRNGHLHIIDGAAAGNETLPSSGFAKGGTLPTDMTSPTFWEDLYGYFAPMDVGDMLAGYPDGMHLAKGAVQSPAGGSSTLIVVED